MATEHIWKFLDHYGRSSGSATLQGEYEAGPLVSNEVFESRGAVRRGILDCERDTLGLSEQIKIVCDAEVPQEVVQLGDEEPRHEKASRLVAQTR